jgi:hypothetical protein
MKGEKNDLTKADKYGKECVIFRGAFLFCAFTPEGSFAKRS